MAAGGAEPRRRVVSLRRGARGFGFNLAEQYPCYLSAVHRGGVADAAGLRFGDLILAVNGVDVQEMSHRDIAEMIARCDSRLVITVQQPPPSTIACSGTALNERRAPCRRYSNFITPIADCLTFESVVEQDIGDRGQGIVSGRTVPKKSTSEPDVLKKHHQSSMIAHTGDDSTTDSSGSEPEPDLLYQAVLVYIGSVPVASQQYSKRKILRSALQTLKAQKARAHTVLLKIYSDHIVAVNSHGLALQQFNNVDVAFVASCPENRQYFCITTLQAANYEKQLRPASEAVSHVFAVDPELSPHSLHCLYGKRFGIRCNRALGPAGACLEFPALSSPVLRALSSVFNQPKPTLHSTTSTSSAGFFEPNRPFGNLIGSSISTDLVQQHHFSAVDVPSFSGNQLSPRAERLSRQKLSKCSLGTSNLLDALADITVIIKFPLIVRRKEAVQIQIQIQIQIFNRRQEVMWAIFHGCQAALNSFESNLNLPLPFDGINASTSFAENPTAAVDRIRQWATNFEALMRDTVGIRFFTDFLTKEFSEENIEFWLACEKYKMMDHSKRKEFGMNMYNVYFSSDSKKQINVDSKTKSLIKNAADGGSFDDAVFIKAQQQIYDLMKFDCYPRFVRSNDFKCLLGGGSSSSADDQSNTCLAENVPENMNRSDQKVALVHSRGRKSLSLFSWKNAFSNRRRSFFDIGKKVTAKH
ncbi:Regulator of G-protein signaling [Trichinella spiralis]|uniref:Regulator of G-protein signaling n=1 Tax=Trichinella spiralis TaxID=6334 RepID=A0ABR3K8I0_TRISP